MGSVTLVLAFLVSIAPGALAWLPGRGWSLEGSSWLALALLPWLALAGLPRGVPSRAAAGRAGPLAVVGLALPALALAAGFDLSAGQPPTGLAHLAGWGLVLIAALALAADRGGRLHAALWLLTVPAAAFLLHALTRIGSQATSDFLPRALAASPLAWPLDAPGAGGVGGGGGPGLPLGALAVVALLVASGGRGRGRAEQDGPEAPT